MLLTYVHWLLFALNPAYRKPAPSLRATLNHAWKRAVRLFLTLTGGYLVALGLVHLTLTFLPNLMPWGLVPALPWQ